MSTFTTLKMALTGARTAYNAYADFRDRKVDEAYDALSSAAETYGPKADDAVESARHAYDESVQKAGHVTKAARARLEKALAAAEDKGGSTLKEVRSSGKQLNRKGRRKAAKLDKKARKASSKQLARVGKKESHWVRNVALSALTASGVAAIVYTLVNKRKDVPGDTPPSLDDLFNSAQQPAEDEEPVLVYSTQTGDEAAVEADTDATPEDIVAEAEAAAAEAADPDAAEETEVNSATNIPVADEVEPLNELSEAEAIQAEFDAKNAPQREQGDK